MFEKLYDMFRSLFDYDIVGEYLDRVEGNIYKKKYIRRYYLRKLKRFKRWLYIER